MQTDFDKPQGVIMHTLPLSFAEGYSSKNLEIPTHTQCHVNWAVNNSA